MISGPLFSFLNNYEKQPNIESIIESHKSEISKARNADGNLSILVALQLLMSYAYEWEEVKQFKESELVVHYRNCLIKIQSELTSTINKRGKIKILLKGFGEVNNQFSSDLRNYDFNNIQKIIEWDKFIESFSQYQIHSRCIRKLLRQLNLDQIIEKMPIQNSKWAMAEQARELIRKTVQTFPKEEQMRLLNVGQGKKGLKKEVWDKIEHSDKVKYFSNKEKKFLNRWVSVLPEIKSNLVD